MRPLLLAVVLASITIMPGALAKPRALYVSPCGNDLWSGEKPKATPEGNDGPLASLQAALRAASYYRDVGKAKDGVTIYLRGGTYALDYPITLTPRDSGTERSQPLTITAYEDEKPVLSGGRRITGWERVPGKADLWQTTVPEVKAGKWYFRQLFMDGVRRQRARTPNEGFFRIDGKSPQDKPVRLKYRGDDLKKAWAESGEVEVVGFLAWADIRMQIRSIDEAGRVAVLSGDPQPSNQEADAQYFIENTPDALDRAGEWYLDRKTGVLTYWGMPGENPNQEEVIAPKLKELLLFRGDLQKRELVQNIRIQGLTFADTDWALDAKGYADTQAAIGIRGSVRGEGVQRCYIEDCKFTRLGGYALEFGRACKNLQIVGNEMVDLAGGGIRLGETQVRKDEFDLNYGNIVTDNHIHHVGLVYTPAVGVFILQSGQNRVAHNHIHHLYYTAVSVGWNWGYQETPCRANVVEYNHLHDIGQWLLSDMGAVYTLGIQEGTVIRNNLVHDVYSFTYGGWGLYTDEGSTHIVLENNVVYRTKSAGFHQHYGKENTVRNNIFAFGTENQVMRSRPESHISFIFTNNIVYFNSGKLLGSNWSNDNYRMEKNLYFDARNPGNAEKMEFSGATLEQWRGKGHDLNSIIADPLFECPAGLDFRLKPESPAFKLGFQPIDLRGVGVRKKSDR